MKIVSYAMRVKKKVFFRENVRKNIGWINTMIVNEDVRKALRYE